MKKPKGIERVSLCDWGGEGIFAYPSLGFISFYEAELGNGDYYGLYWPYGKENEEPIVCDMYHDEWSLKPVFSSLTKFLEWYELNDEECGDEEIDDPDFVEVRYSSLKPKFQSEPEVAIEGLIEICEKFPENSEYWFSLASQLRRQGREEESVNAAVSSMLSNWVFTRPTEGTFRMLNTAKKKGILSDDPLIKRVDSFTLDFGGKKENDVYEVFTECIQEYLERGEKTRGLIMNQNYGYQMMMETSSFQERYGFDLKEWASKHSQLCLEHLGDSRNLIS